MSANMKTPWEYQEIDCGDLGVECCIMRQADEKGYLAPVINFDGELDIDWLQPEHMQRIVTAVNACCDVEDPQPGELARLRAENAELLEALKCCIDALPDSVHKAKDGEDMWNHACWEYCWDELNEEAQDTVKAARAKGNAAIAKHKGGTHEG